MSINTSWKHALQFFKYRKTTKRLIKLEGRVLRCRWLPLAACHGAGEPGATTARPEPKPSRAAPVFSPLQLLPREDHAPGVRGELRNVEQCWKWKAFPGIQGLFSLLPWSTISASLVEHWPKVPPYRTHRLWVSRAGKHRLGCGFGAGRASVTLLLAGWVWNQKDPFLKQLNYVSLWATATVVGLQITLETGI